MCVRSKVNFRIHDGMLLQLSTISWFVRMTEAVRLNETLG